MIRRLLADLFLRARVCLKSRTSHTTGSALSSGGLRLQENRQMELQVGLSFGNFSPATSDQNVIFCQCQMNKGSMSILSGHTSLSSRTHQCSGYPNSGHREQGGDTPMANKEDRGAQSCRKLPRTPAHRRRQGVHTQGQRVTP